MKTVYIVAVICFFALLIVYQLGENQLKVESAFHKWFLATQIAEVELQNKYNDSNITLEVYVEVPAVERF